MAAQKENDFSRFGRDSELWEKFDKQSLVQIVNASYDPIFVADAKGNCLLNSKYSVTAAKVLGVDPQDLVGKNVNELIKAGVYDCSPTLKAIETGTVITELLTTRNGSKIMATSTPIKNVHGEVELVITNVRDRELIEMYIEQRENEKKNKERYKTAVKYLNEFDNEQSNFIAESAQVKKIFKSANFIAKSDSTVMLYGESGTGKEVLAKFIHRGSKRAKEPFIPVNCAAIPHNLFESEFFGYVRGAFTGANTLGKIGLFEIAHNGTLFLDEIGELPLDMQSKLLRVLETGDIQKIGSTRIDKINVRLIAATNRDLQQKVEQGKFRRDLYYRLNVIPITLPPLRERPEDLIALAHKFLNELNLKYGLEKNFSSYAIDELLKYNWPGNIRELRNVIEREFITSTSKLIKINFDKQNNIQTSIDNDTGEKMTQGYKGPLKKVMKELELQYINQVLSECNGRVGEAARLLGIHRTVLYRKTLKE